MSQHILLPIALDHECDVKKPMLLAEKLSEQKAKITRLSVVEDLPVYVVR